MHCFWVWQICDLRASKFESTMWWYCRVLLAVSNNIEAMMSRFVLLIVGSKWVVANKIRQQNEVHAHASRDKHGKKKRPGCWAGAGGGVGWGDSEWHTIWCVFFLLTYLIKILEGHFWNKDIIKLRVLTACCSAFPHSLYAFGVDFSHSVAAVVLEHLVIFNIARYIATKKRQHKVECWKCWNFVFKCLRLHRFYILLLPLTPPLPLPFFFLCCCCWLFWLTWKMSACNDQYWAGWPALSILSFLDTIVWQLSHGSTHWAFAQSCHFHSFSDFVFQGHSSVNLFNWKCKFLSD